MDGSDAFRTGCPRPPGRLTAMRSKFAAVAQRLAGSRLWRWVWHTDHDDSIPATTGVLVQCALAVASIAAQTPAVFGIVLLTPVFALSVMAAEHSRGPR